MVNQKPIHSINVGKGVSAAIWPNTNETGTWYSVTISRTYKDKNGELQDSNRYTEDQLLLVEKAADFAFRYIRKLKRREKSEATN